MIDPLASPAARPAPALPNPKDAETAKSFEAVFLGEFARMMLESVESSGEFSGGGGEEIFRGVLAEKLGTAMAQRGGIGLAPAVLDQIIKLQQGSSS